MSKVPNSDVAMAFVTDKRPCSGSNTRYGRYPVRTTAYEHPGAVQVREFVSYSTVVAVIRDDILWWMDYHSNSTRRQLSYIHNAWRTQRPGKLSVCVPDLHTGASDTNVLAFIGDAHTALTDMLTPRIRMTTKVKHWGTFLYHMEQLDALLALPCYGAGPRKTTMEQVRSLRAIRDSNVANPTGLDATITTVRAVFALEGK